MRRAGLGLPRFLRLHTRFGAARAARVTSIELGLGLARYRYLQHGAGLTVPPVYLAKVDH